ncbi:hypothetical protein ATER59S_04745 [Aquamicrobium terrae]
MKLRPIHRSDISKAADLLAEGFPKLSCETWTACLANIIAHVENLGHDSIGQFASANDGEVGICLTIPSRRVAYAEAPREIMNLSAFYLRPGNEWMATLFLRRLMVDPTVDYVDLTASISMRKLNRRLGFVDRSRGAVVVPLALSALRPARQTRILPLSAIPPGMLPVVHRDLLEEHARLGCIAVGLEAGDSWHPLILCHCRRRGVAGARIILARDRRLVQAALGTIARYLLKRGIHFLEFEALTKDGFSEALFRTEAWPVQTTREPGTEAIDHTFSELAFVPPPGAPAGRLGA